MVYNDLTIVTARSDIIIAHERYTNAYIIKLTIRQLWRSTRMNNISLDLIHIVLHYVLHVTLSPQNIKVNKSVFYMYQKTLCCFV